MLHFRIADLDHDLLIPKERCPAPLCKRAKKGRWGPKRTEKAVYDAFVQYWIGTIKETVALMRHDGWDLLPQTKLLQQWTWDLKFHEAIEQRDEDDSVAFQPGVASARELRQRWTTIVRNADLTATREQILKASEMLAKVKGLFVDRKEISGELGLSLATLVEQAEREEDYEDE